MKQVLVVGGSAVSGQCAIRAIRKFAPGCEIISTSSRESQVKGADKTIPKIDLDQPEAVDTIIDFCRGDKPDYIIYIPGKGWVGMPTANSTPEMVQWSLDYSVIPYLKLHQALQPGKTIALSGFITMEPMQEVYGAMAFTKIAMEDLAVRYPEKLQILRLGLFFSGSVRGIAIVVQRNMKKGTFPAINRLREEWKKEGGRFQDFFWNLNYRFEEKNYRQHSGGLPFRPTTEQDIENGFLKIFEGEQAPIVNVLGDWDWTENTMPELPPVIAENMDLIPADLDKFLI